MYLLSRNVVIKSFQHIADLSALHHTVTLIKTASNTADPLFNEDSSSSSYSRQ